ncbi:hypothetical protein CGC21_37450 [Leishmania donovani]|uniref:RING-type domain-containing protein n=1 Tax=Leishmania donovani TaxID=5661 RepID=A0A504Y0T5_LEIDO|nr:hypothetical protein CGC21_37450 [Leishmania donovani]
MEGIIQYRLLGNHPAASGRYLTVGFPGETTTTDKILDQIIQEHRINTSRYKLEVCRLVPSRDAPASAPVPALPPPESSGSAFSWSGAAAGAPNALVPVVIRGPDALCTYDRLTITVSKRDLADDEASRKEREQLERQRQLKEMEEQLLSGTSGFGHFIDGGAGAHTAVSPPPRPSRFSRSAAGALPSSSPAAPAVDNLRLQRAAALASQLFPIMKGQSSASKGLHDADNTHRCVLCRLSAFEETLTACCRFCVCRSCYASASEMVMNEDQCPVCGIIASSASRAGTAATTDLHGESLANAGGDSTAYRKRERAAKPEDRRLWKREEGEPNMLLQRTTSVQGAAAANSGSVHGDGRAATDVLARPRDAAASAPSSTKASGSGRATVPDVAGSRTGSGGDAGDAAAATPFSKDVLRTEERLRSDLDQALSMLDAPDPLSAAAKAKRIIGAELAALCDGANVKGTGVACAPEDLLDREAVVRQSATWVLLTSTQKEQ